MSQKRKNASFLLKAQLQIVRKTNNIYVSPAGEPDASSLETPLARSRDGKEFCVKDVGLRCTPTPLIRLIRWSFVSLSGSRKHLVTVISLSLNS